MTTECVVALVSLLALGALLALVKRYTGRSRVLHEEEAHRLEAVLAAVAATTGLQLERAAVRRYGSTTVTGHASLRGIVRGHHVTVGIDTKYSIMLTVRTDDMVVVVWPAAGRRFGSGEPAPPALARLRAGGADVTVEAVVKDDPDRLFVWPRDRHRRRGPGCVFAYPEDPDRICRLIDDSLDAAVELERLAGS